MTLIEMIRYDEGQKLTVYKDTEGYWTIGVGHLLTKDPSKALAILELDKLVGNKTYGYINEKQSSEILKSDINNAVKQISRTELNTVYIQLDTVRRSALVNMVFQLGVSGVLKFRKMLKYLQAGEYEKAADESLGSLWGKQTPNRAKRVTDVIRYGDFRSYN